MQETFHSRIWYVCRSRFEWVSLLLINAGHSTLLRNIYDYERYGTAASQRTIQGLIEHSAQNLQVLDLSGCRNVTDSTLQAVSQLCGLLPSSVLTNVNISLCTRLQKLTLSWVDMKTTEEGLESLYKCTALTSLSISNPEWSFPGIYTFTCVAASSSLTH